MTKPETGKAFGLELADKVLRSWGRLVAGLLFGLTGAVVAAHYMPRIYEATTKIWIATQQIPEDVVRTTVKDDMSRRLLAFRDAVLDQPYMIELIERTYGIPETEHELRETIAKIKDNVSVQGVESRRLGMLSFEISYRDTERQRTAAVVNTLTRLYVNQNKAYRAEQATATSKIIEGMAEQAKEEFDETNRRLQEFINEHRFETQDQLTANLQMLESRRRDVEVNREKQTEAEERIDQLENLLTQAKSQPALPVELDGADEFVLDPLTKRIAAVKAELDDLRIRYSERHPEFIKKRRELEDLMALARKQRGQGQAGEGGPGEPPPDPQVVSLEESLEKARQELNRLVSEAERFRREIREYERRIEAEPEVQRQLNVLREEHAVNQEKYRKLQRDAERAKGSQQLEEGELGQRIEVLEYAAVPGLPISPRPERVLFVSLMLGCLVFVGPMVVRYVLNPVVASEMGLRAFADVPVLVTIPSIPTEENRGAGARRLMKNMGWSLFSLAVFVMAILYFT